MYHYAGNNPVRYIDPTGKNDEPNEDVETWTAKEELTLLGMDFRFIYSGMTMLHGYAQVEFTNGVKSFSKKFEVLSIYSEGIFFSLGTNSTKTEYTKNFKKGVTEENVIESYEGVFATAGFSLSLPIFISICYGKTYSIDCNTRKIAEDGWTGITKGESEGIGTGISLPKGFSLNLGLQITVYRDPDKPNNDFSDNPEWFYYKPLAPK